MPFSHSSSKRGSAIQLFDSAYMWSWDATYAGWVLDYKYWVVKYDDNNNVLSELGEVWDGFAWVNSDTTFYTYDERNNELSYEWQFWSGTGWEKDQKGSYEYDANNNMLAEWIQGWDGNDWGNGMMIKKTYDANNNMTSYLHQNWSGEAWDNSFQYINTYDINNNLTSELLQVWTGAQWENSWQNTFVYDLNNNMIHQISHADNGAELVTTETTYYYDAGNKLVKDSIHTSGNSWESDRLGTYYYDSNGNLISWLAQSYNGESLENLTRTLFTYDAAKNQTSVFRQDWKDNTWVNWDLERQTFNEYNSLISYTYRYWDATGTVFMDGDSSTYYYHTVNTGINEISRSNTKNILTIHPNPSSGIFNLESITAINSFEIFNSYGQLIYSESGLNRQTTRRIDLSNYGKGVYLLKILTNTGVTVQKVLKQ